MRPLAFISLLLSWLTGSLTFAFATDPGDKNFKLKAKFKRDVVELKWNEFHEDSGHYEIQRKGLGEEWKLLKRLKEGDEFIDTQPLAGFNYYRIGFETADSEMIFTEVEEVEVPLFATIKWKMTPKTSKGKVTCLVKLTEPSTLTLTLSDQSGHKVREIVSTPGISGLFRKELILSDLPAGAYYATLWLNHEIVSSKRIQLKDTGVHSLRKAKP